MASTRLFGSMERVKKGGGLHAVASAQDDTLESLRQFYAPLEEFGLIREMAYIPG